MEATTASAGSGGTGPSAWAPLRAVQFRALWLAALVGLTGVWFQTVGAQWLLVSRPHASILVSLVQVATTLPYVLFGLVAGVLADTLDRRLILITVAQRSASTRPTSTTSGMTAAYRRHRSMPTRPPSGAMGYYSLGPRGLGRTSLTYLDEVESAA